MQMTVIVVLGLKLIKDFAVITSFLNSAITNFLFAVV
jgi:hypothetical protein